MCEPRGGTALAELLGDAGLGLVDHQGRYEIVVLPPGMRAPAWAARDALLSDGLTTDDDVARWAAALERVDAEPGRPTLFAPLLYAIGRRPAG